MNMKKGMIAAAAVALLGTGTVGVTNTYAAGGAQGQEPSGRFDELIEALAERFDVSTEEVLEVFNEQREEMLTERLERANERLNEAVANGTLTQEQADAIREHREEMHEFMQSLEGMTPEERREAIKAQREESRAWAAENDIPAEFLPHEAPGHRNPHGPRGPHLQENEE